MTSRLAKPHIASGSPAFALLILFLRSVHEGADNSYAYGPAIGSRDAVK